MLSLNLMVGFVLMLLFFNGYSDGWEMYTIPPRDGDSEIQYVIDGATFKMPKHDELIYYALARKNQDSTWYCIDINPTTFECQNTVKQIFFDLINFKRFIRDHNLPEQNWVLKTDIIVLNPTQKVNYPIDVVTFSIPAYCLYIKNEEYLKVLIIIQQVQIFYTGHEATNFHIYFSDPEDKCRQHRPKETLWGNKRFNLNLFANKKWTKYAYYFIKNGKHICAYSLNYEDLFHGTSASAQEIKPVNFQLIDTYPTENYHPDFFCIDSLYGTFVSLYWNKDPNTPPEAHYYIINEKDLKNIQLIDRMVLKGFDMEVIKKIFDNEWDGGDHAAAFQSYGRQIFIWYKPTSRDRYVFNGLWKNENEKIIFSEELGKHLEPQRTLWRARKSYIQFDRPVGRYDAPSLPPPISLFPVPTTTTSKPTTTTPRPTTTSTTTTTKRTTTTTTEATTTTPMQTTTTMPPSTTAPSTSPPITSTVTTPSTSMTSSTSKGTTSSSITSNKTNFTQSTPSLVPSINDSRSDSLSGTKDKECSTDKNDLYLYLLIALIVIDVIEAIILVILVFLKFRGAKKIKEAMARKKSLKSIKKKPKPKEKSLSKKKPKKKMPWKKAKKSTKEKSVTTKTEDDVATEKTVDEKSTAYHTVNQTNYYTINDTFKQDSKKKKKGKL